MKYHLKTHSSEIVNDLTRETQMFGNFLSSLALILTEIPVVLGISLLVSLSFNTKTSPDGRNLSYKYQFIRFICFDLSLQR